VRRRSSTTTAAATTATTTTSQAREGEILRLMEILELPRSVAIELLEENEGSVEAALMQVLG
jgi:hypothetical protein